MAPDRKRRVADWSEMGLRERLKPETMSPAGNPVTKIKGKKLVLSNTNMMSDVDTLIWGRDVDGSMGECAHPSQDPMYSGAAGIFSNPEYLAAWGELPPVCVRTFGATDDENDFEAVTYKRLNPRLDYVD